MTPVAKKPEINVRLSMDQLTTLAQIVANFMIKKNQPAKKDKLLTTKEVCKRLNKHPTTLGRNKDLWGLEYDNSKPRNYTETSVEEHITRSTKK